MIVILAEARTSILSSHSFLTGKFSAVDFMLCFLELLHFFTSHHVYSGDYDVTMDGIHENFLKLNYHDPMLQKTVCA